MHVPAPGESAAQLPWLWPDSLSLSALAHPLSPAIWTTLCRDPGALLLIHRHHSLAAPFANVAGAIESRVLSTALDWFQHDRGGWVDWRHPSVLPVYKTALAVAHHARLIANLTGSCDPSSAWTAGLLTPLGWFAVAAYDSSLIGLCLSDPNFIGNPSSAQQKFWGVDHRVVAERLGSRWHLPNWLRAAMGHSERSLDSSASQQVETALPATVKLAIVLAEQEGYDLGMSDEANEDRLLARLRLDSADLSMVRRRFGGIDLGEAFEREWTHPCLENDLAVRLRTVLKRRRAEATPFVEPLERKLERLHKTLVQLRLTEEERLRQAKLKALAEFAGGASHEINNPLAVIRGQSQYLLNRSSEEGQRKALESIIRQTERIHSILSELMQFARPPQIKPQPVCLSETIKTVVEQYRGQADAAEVSLEWAAADVPVWINGDPRQLQTAIGCLIRNAIEAAAPGKGWARVRLVSLGDRVEVLVEDSGPGPLAAQCEHLFDPFYSGRSAGRGRGLGLPTAWRLAREHGGDVRHVPSPGNPTRFVLWLPLAAHVPERLSA